MTVRDAVHSTRVAIVGGGPVGLFLALALARAGIAARVFERRSEGHRASRSIGIHPPSLELLAELGLADRFVERGVQVRSAEAYGEHGRLGVLDFNQCPPPYRYVLTLPQTVTEEILRAGLEERAPGSVETREVLGVVQGSHDTVVVRLAGLGRQTEREREEEHRCYPLVVGCDGRDSVVRRSLGLQYVGADYAGEYAMADFPDATSLGPTAAVYVGRSGLLESFPLVGRRRRWVARCVAGERPRTEALVAHVRERARVSLDVSQAMHPSSFRAQRFQATRFSEGRVALAGDAAQVVSPIGGQGMNLGWIGAKALAATIASNLGRGDELVRALAHDGLARQRVASAVARRAEVNMWLGRPLPRPWMRDALLSSLLGTPARSLLARAFTMRGLALGC